MKKPHNIIALNDADGITLVVPPLAFASIIGRIIWSLAVLAVGCICVATAIAACLPGQQLFNPMMRWKYVIFGIVFGPCIAAIGTQFCIRLLVSFRCKTVFVIHNNALHATEKTWWGLREYSWERSEIRTITLRDRRPGTLGLHDYLRHLVILDSAGRVTRFLAQHTKSEIVWVADALHDGLRLSEVSEA